MEGLETCDGSWVACDEATSAPVSVLSYEWPCVATSIRRCVDNTMDRIGYWVAKVTGVWFETCVSLTMPDVTVQAR